MTLKEIERLAESVYQTVSANETKRTTESQRHEAATEAALREQLNAQRARWLTEMVDSKAQNESTRIPA